MNHETDIAPRLAEGKDAATIASEINAERRANQISLRRLSYLGLSALLAPEIVRRLIATLDAAAASDALVAETRNFLRSDSGVDVGNTVTRSMLDEFAANAQLPLTVDDAEAIKNLAYLGTLETAESVQGVIDAWNTPANQWSRAVAAGAAVIESGGTLAEAIAAMSVV